MAAAIAAPSSHAAIVESERPASAAEGVRAASRGPATGRTVETTLSGAAIHARPPPHGPASCSAKRRKAGVRARSPADGTLTATARMHPAPNGISVAAGSPSSHRATTRPVGGTTRRTNGATTVAERAGRMPEAATEGITVTPNAVSAGARACQPWWAAPAGQTTTAPPCRAQTVSAAVVESRITRTAPAGAVPASASAAETGSLAPARTSRGRARVVSLGEMPARIVCTVPGQTRRMDAVAASRASLPNGDTTTISTESRTRWSSFAARIATTSPADIPPDSRVGDVATIESTVGFLTSRAVESNRTSASPDRYTDRATGPIATQASGPCERSTTITRPSP